MSFCARVGHTVVSALRCVWEGNDDARLYGDAVRCLMHPETVASMVQTTAAALFLCVVSGFVLLPLLWMIVPLLYRLLQLSVLICVDVLHIASKYQARRRGVVPCVSGFPRW